MRAVRYRSTKSSSFAICVGSIPAARSRSSMSLGISKWIIIVSMLLRRRWARVTGGEGGHVPPNRRLRIRGEVRVLERVPGGQSGRGEGGDRRGVAGGRPRGDDQHQSD